MLSSCGTLGIINYSFHTSGLWHTDSLSSTLLYAHNYVRLEGETESNRVQLTNNRRYHA